MQTWTELTERYDSKNGSPLDRGSADSYYNRGYDPHYYPEGTYKGTRIEMKDMTAEDIAAYTAGYNYNEKYGDKKNWD